VSYVRSCHSPVRSLVVDSTMQNSYQLVSYRVWISTLLGRKLCNYYPQHQQPSNMSVLFVHRNSIITSSQHTRHQKSPEAHEFLLLLALSISSIVCVCRDIVQVWSCAGEKAERTNVSSACNQEPCWSLVMSPTWATRLCPCCNPAR